MKIVVVIAAYNESETIRPLTARLVQVLDSLKCKSWKLIYVIEGTDGTVDIVREFAARRREIEILYNEQPTGLGRAFRRGFDAIPADADLVVTMDADLNHQPEEIPRLVAAAQRRQADIVVGSRRVEDSSVEGMPLLKTAISRSVNRTMHLLMGLRVNDLTSGFRVYRASELRQLQFENTGFAFLPEILIGAAARGLKVVEEPIHFTVRPAGESKMDIVATSLSYVRLFATHSVAITTWMAVAILLLGLVVRVAFCLPAHKYAGDSDAMLAGLCALDVTHGKLPLFFPGGYRLSSQSCYVTAAMFKVFGPNRSALAGTSIFYGILFLIFSWLALREAAGPRAAVVGLVLVAFPPLQFWLVTYPVWGYGEVMAFSACTMWLGFRLLRTDQKRPGWEACLFGFSVGFSFWTSPQTIMISVPVCAMLLWKRRFTWRSAVVAAGAAALALLPYIVVVAYQGLAPFTTSFQKPVSTVAQLIANTDYLFTYTLPVLLFSLMSQQIPVFSFAGLRVILIVAGSLLLVVLAVRRSAGRPTVTAARVPPLLPLAIALFGCTLYILSGVGSIRGWTVRYVAPVFLAIPLSATLLFRRVHGEQAKAAVVVCAIAVAGLQMWEYPIFHPQVRREAVAALADNRAIVAWLEKNHRNLAIGDYWAVYSLNFDSLGSIIALPTALPEDYFNFNGELRQRQASAALIDQNPAHLGSWVKRLGQPGHMERIDNNVIGFLLDKRLDANAVEQTCALGQ